MVYLSNIILMNWTTDDTDGTDKESTWEHKLKSVVSVLSVVK